MRERLNGVLAAITAVLCSAEWQTENPSEIVVDKDHPDVDSTRDAQSTLGVSRV